MSGKSAGDLIDRLVAWGCQLLHLQKHTHILQQLAKFVIVGVASTIIDWGIYFVLADLVGWDPLIANIPAFAVATVFSFFTSIFWVFDTTKRKTRRRLFVEFIVLNLVAFALNELLLFVFINQLGLGNMIAKVITTAIVMVFNYLTRKLFLEDRAKPSGELIDVLDATGKQTGRRKPRSEVHRDGDWHGSVFVVVQNHQGDVLLQLRAPDKDSYPNRWDISCGGHISAGEDALTTAQRELEEELGVHATTDQLRYIATIPHQSHSAANFIDNCFYSLYFFTEPCELDELHYQESEIAAIKFVSGKQLRKMVQSHDPSLVPHWDAGTFERVLQELDQQKQQNAK